MPLKLSEVFQSNSQFMVVGGKIVEANSSTSFILKDGSCQVALEDCSNKPAIARNLQIGNSIRVVKPEVDKANGKLIIGKQSNIFVLEKSKSDYKTLAVAKDLESRQRVEGPILVKVVKLLVS